MEKYPLNIGKTTLPEPGEIHLWKAFNAKKETKLTGDNFPSIDRVSSISKHGGLSPSRRIVAIVAASYLGVSVDAISLGVNEGGKPYIEGSGSLHFNISHCGAELAIAFACEPIGFDMERKDRNADFIGLAKRFFSVAEAIEIEQYGGALFLKWWTAKEAMLKLVGSGLQGGLKSAEVISPGVGCVCGEEVTLKAIEWPEHHAHVASHGEVKRVREFEIKELDPK